MSKPTTRNGFVRAVPENTLQPQFSINLPGRDLYFAGTSNGTLYLGNLLSPRMVIEVSDSSVNTFEIEMGTFPDAKTSKVLMLPPYFFLADLVDYRVYRGTIADWRLYEEVHTPGKFFTELVPVSNQGLVLRTYHKDDNMFTLTYENSFTGEHIPESSLLEKQVDGIICTDGILLFDKHSSQIVYTYFSRNQFICTDSTLQLNFRAHTIDTTFYAKIKVAPLWGTQGYAMASPPHIVNRRASVSHNTLYINSTLVADNEDEILFKQVDVLDLYDLKDGHYLHSLYLDRLGGKKLRHFIVDQDRVYTLSENILRVYLFDEDVNP